YLNDLAVAARAMQEEGRARRIAIVDLDVHQGNGTAAIFEGDPSVFTLSMHQENNYPAPKQRSDLDVPLADRTGDAEYLARRDAAALMHGRVVRGGCYRLKLWRGGEPHVARGREVT